jgi:hypothetical protein
MIAILWIYSLVTLGLSLLCFIIHSLCKYFEYDANEIYICKIAIKDILASILLLGWTLLWYSISITFTLFNKWFVNIWYGGFNYPIFTTGSTGNVTPITPYL